VSAGSVFQFEIPKRTATFTSCSKLRRLSAQPAMLMRVSVAAQLVLRKGANMVGAVTSVIASSRPQRCRHSNAISDIQPTHHIVAHTVRSDHESSTASELNLAHRRRRAPWLLGTVSDFSRACPPRGSLCPHSGLTECAAHHEYCGWEIAHDEFGLEPDDAIAGAGELAIPSRVQLRGARDSRHRPRR